MPSATLRVSEIFWSIQGETSRAGLPTVFIRLSGCPLRCTWCDTDYAFFDGRSVPITAILDEVARYSPHLVCVTGGEPLAQKPVATLLARLCDAGYSVSLETSGALPIAGIDPRVSRIVDIKCPGSGEADKNHWPNLDQLRMTDELKFVIGDLADYEWARDLIQSRRLDQRCPVLVSPVHESLPAGQLADWILVDRLPVRLQVQLHKVLWGSARGR